MPRPRSGRESSLSVGVNMLRSLLSFLLLHLTSSLPQQDGVSHDFMGFDTGNPAADFEAGMWTAALIGETKVKIFTKYKTQSQEH